MNDPIFNVAADAYPGMVAELKAVGATWTESEREWGTWFIVTGTPEQIDAVAARVGLVAR